MNSAELDVKLNDPGALVIAKPGGAETCTEPSIWVNASLVTVNVNVALAPGDGGLDDDTVTAKHLPDAIQVLEVAPAEGAASTADASRPAAKTPKDARATMKPDLRTLSPPSSAPIDGHDAASAYCTLIPGIRARRARASIL